MSADDDGGTKRNRAIQYILIFSLFMILPAVQGAIFGWMLLGIPVTVLFYIYRWEHGFRFVLAGLTLAALASSILGTLGLFAFSAALIPAGYSLAQSAFRNDSPSWSGFKGTLSLAACWIFLLLLQAMITGVNPITDFLASLDSDIEEVVNYYRQSSTIAPDTLVLIEQSFYQMKNVLPKIIPGILTSFALIIVWGTMLSGNQLVQKFAGYRPWPDHQTWRLPDRLIWLFIGSVILTLLPVSLLRLIGINLLIVSSLVYFFQGFAILVFFMHKWNVPPLFRFMLYGMMLFQQFGTILLLIVGVADVWMDLRRIENKSNEQGDPPAET